MFIHVSGVRCEGKYRLRLAFDDGAVKIVDLENELDGPVFEPLRDPTFFRRVKLNKETGTVEWPNGADIAPEFLYDIGSPAEETSARRVAEGRATYGKGKKMTKLFHPEWRAPKAAVVAEGHANHGKSKDKR